MGGFVLYNKKEKIYRPVDPHQFPTQVDQQFTFPTISEDEINDKSKGDGLAKTIAVVQLLCIRKPVVKVEKFRGFSRFCGFLTKTYRRKDRDDNLLFIYFCFYGVLEARLHPNIFSQVCIYLRITTYNFVLGHQVERKVGPS